MWWALALWAHAADGGTLYATYCSSCHGVEGRGDGPVGRVLTPRPADFTPAEFWETRDDTHLSTVVLDGGGAVDKSPLMAGFRGRLTEEQVDLLVAWMRTTWGPPAEEPAPTPPAEEPAVAD